MKIEHDNWILRKSSKKMGAISCFTQGMICIYLKVFIDNEVDIVAEPPVKERQKA